MIREVQPEDYATIAMLWREYLDVPTATNESVSQTLTKMSKDNHYGTYVAEEDKKVVGFITFVEVISIDDPDGYIKMNGIAVLPEYRHRGIAQQLIEQVELEAHKRGSSSIGAATSFKRTGSQRLLDKLKYEKSAFWFHKQCKRFSIHKISDDLYSRMINGDSYMENCVVPKEDLRYLLVLHKDKDGNTRQGEMIVHKLIAKDVLEIFEELYYAGYPIERMVLPDYYLADDETMMQNNNSSCYNFRFISHTNKLSKHGLGMAVDINTLYNPYHQMIKNDDGTITEVIEPAIGKPYLDRTLDFDYKIVKGDLCYTLFTEKGFEWGGDWTDRKDFHHFELPTKITEKYYELYTR